MEGSKLHKRNEECENVRKDIDVYTANVLIRSSHLSRAQRILDFGDIGNLPPIIKPFFGEGVVRHGMGVQSLFFQCIAFVTRNKEFLKDFISKITFTQYIQGHQVARATQVYPKEFKKWWASKQATEYRSIFSLPFKLSKRQSERELHMYSSYYERQILQDIGHETWLPIINAIPGLPHFVVVDVQDNNFVSISVTSVSESKTDISFILKKGKVYEPLGMSDKKAFQSLFSKQVPFVKTLVYTKAFQFKLAGNFKRVINTRYMVVGLMDSTGDVCAIQLPFSVDCSYQHIHASDIKSDAKISKSLPSKLLKITSNSFYKQDYQVATQKLVSNAHVDLQILYGYNVPDERNSILSELTKKVVLEQEYAVAIYDLVNEDLNLKSEKSTKEKIRSLREKYRSRLPKIPDQVTDFILERLIRPVPRNVLPILKQHPYEIINL